MLKNYFTLALKVLGRRKFFTFISLFGISFTLMILMLTAAFWETEFGDNAPLTDKDNLIFIRRCELMKQHYDTIQVIDSQLMDGITVYDTTFTFEKSGRAMSSSSPSLHLLRDHVGKVPFAVNRTIFSGGNLFDVFNKGKKFSLATNYTDPEFWQIFDFEFLAGKPYGKMQFENQEQVAVISQRICEEYLGITGNFESAVGKNILMDGKNFKVVGVIAHVRTSANFANLDVYIPYTNMPAYELESKNYMGGFWAVYSAASADDRAKMKSEINAKSKVIPIPEPDVFDVLNLRPMTYGELYAYSLIYNEEPERSLQLVLGSFLLIMILFFLLPTLNLINLNVSRIMERSSEIGVRKAFGAHSGNIMFQFVFENVILTFIGGFIGFVLAYLLMNLINDTGFLEDTKLSFDIPVFVLSLLIILFFGILSGIIPAWRMSKLQIANALKVNQL